MRFLLHYVRRVAYDSKPNQFVLMQTFLQIRLLQIIAALCFLSVIPAHGGWTATGSMNVARIGHVSNRLLDGRVLVAGGYDGSRELTSAEIFDPTTGTWTTTGSMVDRCGSHSLLLSSGKVLVFGSWTNCQLYDPLTGTWVATGPMNYARSASAAVLLKSGKVLVTGGTINPYSSSSAEIYDPLSGVWTMINPMSNIRYGHTASLLNNGKVLVAGGDTITFGVSVHSNTCELYDPEFGTWTTTGSMNTFRDSHYAILDSLGNILVIGGAASLESYNPTTGSWTTVGNLLQTRRGFISILLNNSKILVSGGTNGGWQMLSSSEYFNPAGGESTVAGSMNLPRGYASWTLLKSGKVLVVGGSSLTSGNSPLASAELFSYPPTIVTHPASVTLNQGRLATFVTTSSGGDLTYQWKKGGVEIPNATSASFTLNNAQLSDAGSYTVVVTNSEGSVTSQPATLTVIPDSDGDGLGDAEETGTYNTDPNMADSDGDGLTDFAEVRTHNTNPLSKDSDGDGFYDAYELQTGKSPLNAADKPLLVAEARTAIEFSFPSATGKTYRIEGSPNLDTWSTVEDGINGTGAGITRFYSTRHTPVRFFRVEESVNP